MIKFYNTLTRKKTNFKSIEEGRVKIYTCGPTLYSEAHIGNLSAYLFADLLKRYLKYRGYAIEDVMNLTDVDDKTIRDSQKSGMSLKEYTEKYEKTLYDDFQKLGIKKPKTICKATEHINEMIALIEKLIEKGIAYKTKDGSVYYNIGKFEDYGKLSRLGKRKLKYRASGRIDKDEYDKENLSDFVLWKARSEEDGDVYWDSPFGEGRPGWHIECSAMSMKYLGETFDIHTGAIDLIFPHHENEIAQSEGAAGKQFVKYWMHRDFLKINNSKMAKSLKNDYKLKDIVAKIPDPLAFRFFILTNHYRRSLNFTFEALDGARNSLQKIQKFTTRLDSSKRGNPEGTEAVTKRINELIEAERKNQQKHLDNDLNTPLAIASLFNFMKKINKVLDEGKISSEDIDEINLFLHEIDEIWGFIFKPATQQRIKVNVELVNKLIKERNEYRKQKDWKKADQTRKIIENMGVILQDTKDSSEWSLK